MINNKTGEEYKVVAANSFTDVWKLLLLPAFAFGWIGSHNIWSDTSMYIYDEFYKQGIFADYYKDINTK